MTFIGTSPILGEVDLSTIDPAGPGPFAPFNGGTTRGWASGYMEEIKGFDPNLGAGVFVYAQFSGTIAAKTVVEFTPSLSGGKVVMSATAWAGTANTGQKLGAAVASGVAGQWGWFQVDGNALVACQGAPAAGNPAYWQASGVVSPTAVAGKQALGMTFATAANVTIGQGSTAAAIGATTAVVTLSRPIAQGAIT